MVLNSETELWNVGAGRMPGMSPAEPAAWLAAWLARDELRSDALPTLGCTTLLGAVPVGAAKPRISDEELPRVGCTTSSGRPPVEPTTDSGLAVRRALLRMGAASESSGRRPAELVVTAELELEEKVGLGSLEGMPPPVEARIGSASVRFGRRPSELVVAAELELEENVGLGSLEGMPPPVEARIGSASVRSGRRPLSVELELEMVGWGSSEGTAPPVEATNALDGLVLDSSSGVVEDAVGWTTLLGIPTDGV
jgi:hypothetical protein